MQYTRFAALAASRRTAITALLGGLPSLLLAAGSDDTSAQKRNQRRKPCKKGRKPCNKPRPKCDVCRKGCDFTSVQDAIDAAASGSTIKLCAEVYEGQISIREKAVTLIGAGDGEGGTTLDGKDVITTLIGIQDASVSLERLRITGAAGAFGGGISSQRSALTLTACTVSGNNAAAGGGIFVEGGNLILKESVVSGNAIGLIGGGIYFDSNDGVLTLTKSRVEVNKAGDEGGGIALVSGTMTLIDSSVEGNEAGSGGGIYRFDGTATLQNSIVVGNTPDNCVGIGGCN